MYKSAARFRCHSGRIGLGKTPSGRTVGPCNASSHKKKKHTKISRIFNGGKPIELSLIKSGDKLHGTVTSILDYGAFVDLGGATGLLHISEISDKRIDNIKSVLKIGQRIEPKVKEISKDNHGKYKISLTLLEKSKIQSIKEKQVVDKPIQNKHLPPARFTGFGTIGDLLLSAVDKSGKQKTEV